MDDAAFELRGAIRIGTARRRFIVAADGLAAGRADLRHFVWQSVRRPLCHIHADDLRDDVSRLLHKHGISDADVALMDIIDIVERRGGNGRTGKTHRRKDRARRQNAGSADLDGDIDEPCSLSFRREFVGYRPFGRAGIFTDLGAFGEIVRLDDDAVDIKGKGLPQLPKAFDLRDDLFCRLSERAVGITWKPCDSK